MGRWVEQRIRRIVLAGGWSARRACGDGPGSWRRGGRGCGFVLRVAREWKNPGHRCWQDGRNRPCWRSELVLLFAACRHWCGRPGAWRPVRTSRCRRSRQTRPAVGFSGRASFAGGTEESAGLDQAWLTTIWHRPNTAFFLVLFRSQRARQRRRRGWQRLDETNGSEGEANAKQRRRKARKGEGKERRR